LNSIRASEGCWFSGTESSAEVYDPVKGVFTDAGNMTAPREWHTVTLLNSGDVLLAGGAATETSATGGLGRNCTTPYRRHLRPALFSLRRIAAGVDEESLPIFSAI
jgi:hypothetical protein